jgi:hypothetical protein
LRRSREEAARTRRAAVKAASRLFRQRGIGAVGVDEVMAELGMTAGGFYRHFRSKEALSLRHGRRSRPRSRGERRKAERGPPARLTPILDEGTCQPAYFLKVDGFVDLPARW